MKNETAVHYLLKQIEKHFIVSPKDVTLGLHGNIALYTDIINEAKEMEERQIAYAYKSGHEKGWEDFKETYKL